jgi:large subunit ribosomal protein L31e
MAKVVVERIYSIRLKHKLKRYPRWLRAVKAMRYIRRFLSKHMKVSEENVKIDPSINLKVWERGIQKPPTKIRIRAVKFDDGIVEAELYTGETKKEEIKE